VEKRKKRRVTLVQTCLLFSYSKRQIKNTGVFHNYPQGHKKKRPLFCKKIPETAISQMEKHTKIKK